MRAFEGLAAFQHSGIHCSYHLLGGRRMWPDMRFCSKPNGSGLEHGTVQREVKFGGKATEPDFTHFVPILIAEVALQSYL